MHMVLVVQLISWTYVHDLPLLLIQLSCQVEPDEKISDLRELARPNRGFSIYCWVARSSDGSSLEGSR
jgi:hypothetical protein